MGGWQALCLGCWCPPAALRGRAAGWAQCKDKALARAQSRTPCPPWGATTEVTSEDPKVTPSPLSLVAQG